MDDAELLRRYAEAADQAAFTTLVERRLPLVYSAALRQVGGDAHFARDVAQVVFVDLARKARALVDHPFLVGWLYTSTHFAAAKTVRREQRRRQREREAQSMDELTSPDLPPADWGGLRPTIDAAMQDLNERDREAVLLRFFENRGFAEIGVRLRVGENTARMRVERALEKLHAALVRRGIRSTASALGVALAANAVGAAPAGLASAIAAAVPATATLGVSTLLMSVTKLQWAAGATVLTIGALTGIVQYQANSALARDVVQLRTAADEISADRKRLATPPSDPAEKEKLRAEVAELPDLQRRVREGVGELDRLQAAHAVASPSRQGRKAPAGVVLPLRDLDVMPQPKEQVAPTYPAALREFGIPGRVVVSFVIGFDGAVADAKVVSSTHSAFEEPALAAMEKWKFAPGRKSDVAVNARAEMALVFSLEQKNGGWF